MSKGWASLPLSGVASLQWLYDLTVCFDDLASMQAAQALTGWTQWDTLILAVPTTRDGGFEIPLLLANGVGYCGLFLGA